MQFGSGRMLVVLVVGALAAMSCGAAADAPAVSFGDGTVVGTWRDAARDASADVETDDSSDVEPPGRVVSKNSETTPSPAAADSGVPLARGGAGGSAKAADSGGTGGSAEAAGSGGTSAPTTGSVTSLTFQVTTSPAGGRYQPKNIGAIWIEDSTGKVVKSLEVWAATRRRYLTGYLGAMAGSSIDVKTSATLSRHQTHSVTWDLKDRSGETVAPGAFRLRMELTDADRTGMSSTVSFETSMGPSSPAIADAPSFGAMKLILQ